MTRIISGRAGGTVLDVPAKGTRPTSDRVRESLFGALESAGLLDGARVADLYAGSGALGLESLSRGAASADLVELSAPAAGLIRRNAARVGAAGVSARASVHRANVTAYLTSVEAEWDLV
ncbi:MAG: 16S rRNA (guanine(966)-N(2))-methyltransferase RsmD, partial [Actinobacteria bacterium]|nr:16S rRNA (guanine(966)-N(2))-methyltransferase RsmD [Actinomycetota bacterium]